MSKQEVSKDFAAGVMAAHALVKHIEEGAGKPVKSMLQVTTNSPTEALECYMRTLYVAAIAAGERK